MVSRVCCCSSDHVWACVCFLFFYELFFFSRPTAAAAHLDVAAHADRSPPLGVDVACHVTQCGEADGIVSVVVAREGGIDAGQLFLCRRGLQARRSPHGCVFYAAGERIPNYGFKVRCRCPNENNRWEYPLLPVLVVSVLFGFVFF